MVTGSFPCVRVGKTVEAMSNHGWSHEVLCAVLPPQLPDVYDRVYEIRGCDEQKYAEVIRNSDAEIIHVNNEPNWSVKVAKEAAGGRPVVYNVHDITSARPNAEFDPFEEEAYRYADAFVFVTEQQREFAIACGFAVEGKPYVVIGNFTSSSFFIDSTPLPHIGGCAYEGGLDDRGSATAWRDQSPVADILAKRNMELHIYSDTTVSYGTRHPVEADFPLLVQRLAQHDWGICGVAVPNNAWGHSVPNKFFDYMAAGIPVIAFNCPAVRKYCDMGFGVYLDDPRDIAKVVHSVDRKPFIAAIKAGRSRFTFGRHIEPLVKLYEELTCD